MFAVENCMDELEKLLTKYKRKRQELNKEAWYQTFLDMAYRLSKRSDDAQSQFGAIIVNKTNEIVTDGFNGFIRGISHNGYSYITSEDKNELYPIILPNQRPEKYDWMFHAEHNAILNAARQGKSTLNCKIFVTGIPCLQCSQAIWQAGITEVIHPDINATMTNNSVEQAKLKIFYALTQHKLTFTVVPWSPPQ